MIYEVINMLQFNEAGKVNEMKAFWRLFNIKQT